MKTIQEIFDLAINTGLYGADTDKTVYCPDGQEREVSRYMCFSLISLRWAGHITEEEGEVAKSEIEYYLSEFGYLADALSYHGLPYSFEDCLAVYKDWENRPRLKM